MTPEFANVAAAVTSLLPSKFTDHVISLLALMLLENFNLVAVSEFP